MTDFDMLEHVADELTDLIAYRRGSWPHSAAALRVRLTDLVAQLRDHLALDLRKPPLPPPPPPSPPRFRLF